MKLACSSLGKHDLRRYDTRCIIFVSVMVDCWYQLGNNQIVLLRSIARREDDRYVFKKLVSPLPLAATCSVRRHFISCACDRVISFISGNSAPATSFRAETSWYIHLLLARGCKLAIANKLKTMNDVKELQTSLLSCLYHCVVDRQLAML